MKEHIARTIKEFYNKNQEYADIRNGLVAAITIDVEEPMFESQTKKMCIRDRCNPVERNAITICSDFNNTVSLEMAGDKLLTYCSISYPVYTLSLIHISTSLSSA